MRGHVNRYSDKLKIPDEKFIDFVSPSGLLLNPVIPLTFLFVLMKLGGKLFR
ncbi:hypothetical protein OAE39_02200 [Akkermansiaceae bacterium]|nr:hypothetical protein [Akkermansiaceae bacterium]